MQSTSYGMSLHTTTSFLDEEKFGCLSLPVGSVATAFKDFSSDQASPCGDLAFIMRPTPVFGQQHHKHF